ncbi:protein SAWADEE HOMEODOMAIN HOMOLOG 1-like isoform X2 [Silene latifolia]|uniref:protein SAWADEE HOMEODOMAIN HOMOLOG 1-like isoform X2 n=1 Tax=Silene latifolia TaxID=37657 RepID=UPI003D784983
MLHSNPAMEEIQAEYLSITPTIFSYSEIAEMENIFRDIGKDSLNQEFYQDLATSFSSAICRIGKPSITWQQVESWFHYKLDDSTDASISRKMAETSIVLKGGTAAELQELAFEARSFKDNAWYDVSTFLNYRVLSTGELEARVRFAGFGISHDEWVNVRTGVRERSVPLDPSDCHKVKERPDYAVYVDAHIMEIQRRLHDIKGCRCIYVVRFDDDKTEEKVELSKICCRPK